MAAQAERYQLKNKVQRQVSLDTKDNPTASEIIILKPLGFDIALLTEDQANYMKSKYSGNIIIQKINY